MNSRFLNALKGTNFDRPPLWMMRQAGRYLPEYRELRAKYDFLTLCSTPELIAEVTLQPIHRFDFDAAILFSDILVIPDAMGLGLSFAENHGPIFAKKVGSIDDIEQLKKPAPFIKIQEGIKLIKKAQNLPLIGFAGAPFTVASYMIEGGSSPHLRNTRNWMEIEPLSFHLLLTKIAQATADYLNEQIKAGVDAIQIFDSWASYLNDAQFKEFSLFYLNEIKSKLPKDFPIIFFAKGCHDLTDVSQNDFDLTFGIDQSQNLAEVRKILGPKVGLQGNLDPDVMLKTSDDVAKAADELLNSMNDDPAWVFNLGHGIKPNVPLENVYALRDTVFNFTTAKV